MKLSNEIISSIARTYQYISRIDIQADYFEEINNRDTEHLKFTKSGKLSESNEKVCRQYVAEEYQEAFFKFVDLKTLPERMKNEETLVLEYRMKDGDWHRLRFVEKKRDENGVLTHVLCLIRSISDTKKWEHELMYQVEEARKAAALKARFLSNMSHDIRTPMNALLGYSELIKRELTDPKLLDYQEKMEQSGNLLLSIINNVLDMARIESGKVELDEDYVKIRDIYQGIYKIFQAEAEKKCIHLKMEYDVKHEHVICDETKNKEIFLNLISNAVKYTASGGRVTIRITELDCDRKDYVRIRTQVIDTGIGMSEEFLPSLFEAFARERNTTDGKIAGTGLGMPIIKKYIDMMYGTIEVESKQGEGSKFTVTLEYRIADKSYYEQDTEKSSDVDETDRISGKHILLAEDNDLNAEIAQFILEDMGLMVDRVEDGVQCVSRIEQKPAGTYDLILMDIQMPNMDGYRATEMIRGLSDKDKATIPIIAMTANAFEEDRKKALAKGMNGHIAKPVDAEKVEKTICSVLGSQSEQ